MRIDFFKKEHYSIPPFNYGGSTRTSTGTLASTGDPIYVVSGATGVYVTVNGLRYGSTKLAQETFCTTVSSSAGGIASAYSDWTKILGMSLTDKYGMNMTTQLVEVSVYSVSTASTAQLAYSSSGCKGTKMVAFSLQGKDVTVNNISGNGYISTRNLNDGTNPVAPTSNNSFKFANDVVIDERVRDYILFNSDTGGAVAQVRVWEG